MENGIKNYKYHSLYVDLPKCVGHMTCMKVCPTKAIRIRKGKAKIINDRCVDCGECIKVCKTKAIIPLTDSFTDLSRFKHCIAIPSPALYGQFPKDILPPTVHKGLLKLGFNEVVDIFDTCEAVSIAIEEMLKEYTGPKPLITTFCPTIVRLVQIRFPELVDNLLRIESPREIVAREAMKERTESLKLDENEIGIIYITPCPSKMVSIVEHPGREKSYISGAISIADIYRPLLEATNSIEIKNEEKLLKEMSAFGLHWAMLGGVAKPVAPNNWLAVSGIPDVIRILSDIEDRKISEVDLIECDSCIGGCIGGSLCIDNMYVARSKILKLTEMTDNKTRWSTRKIRKLKKEKYFTKNITSVPPKPTKPLDTDISKAIEKMKAKENLILELPLIDCGVCGSPSCRSFAEDVILGHAKITDCFQKRDAEQKRKKKREIKNRKGLTSNET